MITDNYQDLRDTIVNSDGNPNNVDQRVILPSSYYGGPRFMFEKQQDVMSYVRKFGWPDLFITVTTNPNWEEITTNLFTGQRPHDHPELIVSVSPETSKDASTH